MQERRNSIANALEFFVFLALNYRNGNFIMVKTFVITDCIRDKKKMLNMLALKWKRCHYGSLIISGSLKVIILTAFNTSNDDRATIVMMTSSNGNIFRITGPLCGEFTGPWWIPLTKDSDVELWCFLWSAPWIINGWVNNHEAGDSRHHRAHYDVIIIVTAFWFY